MPLSLKIVISITNKILVALHLQRVRLLSPHIDGVKPPPVVRIGIGNDDALSVEDFHFLCVQGLAGGDRDNFMLEQVNDTLGGAFGAPTIPNRHISRIHKIVIGCCEPVHIAINELLDEECEARGVLCGLHASAHAVIHRSDGIDFHTLPRTGLLRRHPSPIQNDVSEVPFITAINAVNMDVEIGIDQLFIRCSGTDTGSIPLKLIQQIENLVISSRNALHLS